VACGVTKLAGGGGRAWACSLIIIMDQTSKKKKGI
jgi:hypothetical protein